MEQQTELGPLLCAGHNLMKKTARTKGFHQQSSGREFKIREFWVNRKCWVEPLWLEACAIHDFLVKKTVDVLC